MVYSDSYLFESNRLGLRPFQLRDAADFYEMNLEEEVLRYTGDKPFRNPEEAGEFIKNYTAYENWGYGRWAVILKDQEKFIGFCGFKLNEESDVDLGFRIIKSEWNKGFASESAGLSIAYGFNTLGFERIIGRVAPENLASIRVLEKMGMSKYKTGDCHGIPDAIYYELTKNQYYSNHES